MSLKTHVRALVGKSKGYDHSHITNGQLWVREVKWLAQIHKASEELTQEFHDIFLHNFIVSYISWVFWFLVWNLMYCFLFSFEYFFIQLDYNSPKARN